MTDASNSALAWQDSPDPFRPLMIPIYSAKVDRPVNLVIVTPSLVGAETHYFDSRTRPHVVRGVCEGCDRHIDKRWKGYLGCWDRHKGRMALAEVTREAFEKCPGFKDYKDRLRGLVVQLVRNGSSKNARVTAKLMAWAGSAVELPPPVDVKAALQRIWFTHQGQQISEGEFLAGAKPEDVRVPTLKPEGLFEMEGPYGR
jgi:hypothetical protein